MVFKKKRRYSRARAMPTRRRRSYGARGFFRRHKPKTIPILPTVGFGAGALAGKPDGWTSPIEGIMRGDRQGIMLAAQTGIRNITGIKVGMPDTGYTQGFEFNVFNTLNPFDMNEAPALKGLFWGSAISMGLRWLGINRKYRDMVKKIPFLNKTSL